MESRPEKRCILPNISLSVVLALGSLSFLGQSEDMEPRAIVATQAEKGETELPQYFENTLGDMAVSSCITIQGNIDNTKCRTESGTWETANDTKNRDTRAEELQHTVDPADYLPDCEQYLPLLERYDWPVDEAMLVMQEESGCDPDAVSPTDDHGLFQLNGQRVYEPSENTAIAYDKYVEGRIGENNWSAWYAVCTPGNDPKPKFAGLECR